MSQSNLTSFFRPKRKDTDEGEMSDNVAPTVAAKNHDTDGESEQASCSSNMINPIGKKQKLAQTFSTKWRINRPWLKYVPNEGMYCTYCQKQPHSRSTAWRKTPSVRIRLQNVNEHEETAEHRDSVKAEMAATQSQNVAKLLTNPENISEDGMVQAFKCLYFLCKNNIAHTTNFPKLLELEKLLGIDIKQKISKGNNAKYTSNTAIRDMLQSVSDVIETEILDDIKNSDAYALMFDETTDVSVVEQMVIHGRYINSTGDVSVKYLKVLDALELQSTDMNELDDCFISLNADAVSQKITDYIESNGLPYEKLRGIGTDGAAVMTGRLNGAVKQIIDRQCEKQKDTNDPHKLVALAIGQHCAAHKLNLAAKQAGTNFPVIQKFKRVVKSLHAFYSRSAVRTKGLTAVQNLLKDSLEIESDSKSGSGKVKNPAETRWLALGECATKLKGIVGSVSVSLEREAEERGDAGAAGLVNLMTRFDFLATLCLMCEVLPTINRLSLQFQVSHINFSTVSTSLAATIAILKAKKEVDLTGTISGLEAQGIKIKTKLTIPEEVANFRIKTQAPFIDAIIDNIEARFQNSEFLASFSKIFNPQSYGTSKVQPDEMCSHAAKLCEQFGLPKDTAINEMKDFIFYVQAAGDINLSQSDFLTKLTIKSDSNVYCATFPSLCKLAHIYKVLPPHTSDCERDFSQMKLIKTDIRNRMGEDTLDYLLRINIAGPPIEQFPFGKAVKLWSEKKDRRYKVRLV